ncbi:MAG: PIN domain-containing protein [Planctomycetes bacterium]|nr:PIN domain-containing protein [Planctomycetota bacterium]
MKVFIDTNVLLDVLAERKDFYTDAMRVWTLAEAGRIDAHVSAISFSNCYYIVHKHAGRRSAEKALRLLRDVFKPAALTAQILNQAIDAGFADFEDAVQFHSAVHAQSECIITRNPDHFPRTPLSVLSPAEFLAVHSFE